MSTDHVDALGEVLGRIQLSAEQLTACAQDILPHAEKLHPGISSLLEGRQDEVHQAVLSAVAAASALRNLDVRPSREAVLSVLIECGFVNPDGDESEFRILKRLAFYEAMGTEPLGTWDVLPPPLAAVVDLVMQDHGLSLDPV